MPRILLICALALLLSGCYTTRDRYIGGGALIGGATGAVIGGAASGGSGALVGGAIGAVAGGLIGAAIAPPEECYVRTKRGRGTGALLLTTECSAVAAGNAGTG